MLLPFSGAPPRQSRSKKEGLETTFAAVYKDGIDLGLDTVFPNLVRSLELEIVREELLHPDSAAATDFLMAADPMSTWDTAKKIWKRYRKEGRSLVADFGSEEIAEISSELYKRNIHYIAQPLLALEIRGWNAVEQVRNLVEAPKGSGLWSIRTHFYPDCFDTANAEKRAFQKRAHAAKDLLEADGGRAWFNRHAHTRLKAA